MPILKQLIGMDKRRLQVIGDELYSLVCEALVKRRTEEERAVLCSKKGLSGKSLIESPEFLDAQISEALDALYSRKDMRAEQYVALKDWLEAIERKDDHPQKTDRFWCSALVGYIYTKAGLLKEDTDWSVLRASDFSKKYNGNLNFTKGCSLENNEIEIL